MDKASTKTVVIAETLPHRKSTNGKALAGADTSTLQPAKTTYEGYTFRRADPVEKGGRKTWRNVKRTLMPVTADELVKQVRKQQRGKPSIVQQYSGLGAIKQEQIDRLVEEKQKDKNKTHDWAVVSIGIEERNLSMWAKETVSMQVIIKGERLPETPLEKTTAFTEESGVNIAPKPVAISAKSTTVSPYVLPSNSLKNALGNEHIGTATAGEKKSHVVSEHNARMIGMKMEPRQTSRPDKAHTAEVVILPSETIPTPYIVQPPVRQGATPDNPQHVVGRYLPQPQDHGAIHSHMSAQVPAQYKIQPVNLPPPPPPPPPPRQGLPHSTLSFQAQMHGPHEGTIQHHGCSIGPNVAQHHSVMPAQVQGPQHEHNNFAPHLPAAIVSPFHHEQKSDKTREILQAHQRSNDDEFSARRHWRRSNGSKKLSRNMRDMLKEEKHFEKSPKQKVAHARSNARVHEWLEDSDYDDNNSFDKHTNSETDSTTNTSLETEAFSSMSALHRGSLYRSHRTNHLYKWHQRGGPIYSPSCLSQRDQDIITEILSRLSFRDQSVATPRQSSGFHSTRSSLADRMALLDGRGQSKPSLISHNQYQLSSLLPEAPHVGDHVSIGRGRNTDRKPLLLRPNIAHAYLHIDPRDISGRRAHKPSFNGNLCR